MHQLHWLCKRFSLSLLLSCSFALSLLNAWMHFFLVQIVIGRHEKNKLTRKKSVLQVYRFAFTFAANWFNIRCGRNWRPSKYWLKHFWWNAISKIIVSSNDLILFWCVTSTKSIPMEVGNCKRGCGFHVNYSSVCARSYFVSFETCEQRNEMLRFAHTHEHARNVHFGNARLSHDFWNCISIRAVVTLWCSLDECECGYIDWCAQICVIITFSTRTAFDLVFWQIAKIYIELFMTTNRVHCTCNMLRMKFVVIKNFRTIYLHEKGVR